MEKIFKKKKKTSAHLLIWPQLLFKTDISQSFVIFATGNVAFQGVGGVRVESGCGSGKKREIHRFRSIFICVSGGAVVSKSQTKTWTFVWLN